MTEKQQFKQTKKEQIDEIMKYYEEENDNNMVESPNHYIGELGLEAEEILRNFLPRYKDSYVAHRIGSGLEYLVRAPEKNGLEDLKKAAYNIQQAIEYIEKRNDVIE